jgi:GNAT superfamily N-acetyltransferase
MLTSFNPQDHWHLSAIAQVWTAANGPDWAFSAATVAANTRPLRGVAQAGQLVLDGGQALGFALASAVSGDPALQTGWVDAIAVAPPAQKSGLGSELLAWAEEWLGRQGCRRARLGGSLRPFTHGLPVDLGSEDFFAQRGYLRRSSEPYEWDVARDLRGYASVVSAPPVEAAARPMQPGEAEALLAFLKREFPGRWHYEAEVFLADGGRPSDFILLWTPNGVEGFCRLTLEDSERPIERFYMHRLPRPWGQLGPLGVGKGTRGKGYGGYLIDAALLYLRSQGVAGCVIDWTNLLDLYARFGFQPYHQYVTLLKDL